MLRVITCLLLAVSLTAHDRSPKWPALRNAYIKVHPSCIVCGKPAEEVHHVVPVHIDPSKELDISNLCSVCSDDHLRIGHLGNFQNVNPDILLHARILRTAKTRADAVRQMKPCPPNVVSFRAERLVVFVDVGSRPATAAELDVIVEQLNAIAGGLITEGTK